MKLKFLTYKESSIENDMNPWELEGLTLNEYNLIVGKNATGKSRIIRVIHNLANLIQFSQVFFIGSWKAIFSTESGQKFEVHIELLQGKVIDEKIWIDGVNKLHRTSTSAKIYSETTSTWQEISPPNDRLVLHVRRDKNEFPFLESLVSWAAGLRGFSFANTSPLVVEIPENPFNLTSLNSVPSALDKLSEYQLKSVLKQLSYMGYNLDAASTGYIEGLSPILKVVFLKEQGITKPLKQFEVSQGMFRAFSLLVIIEFLKSIEGVKSVLIDDFGEGLDFERSKKLAEIIFSEKSLSKIQFIATSNDSFLINTISLDDLTICYRENHIVKCLNYSNSKEKLDQWKQLGLNNFDLFSSNYLLSQ